jgi:hypothetical protein
MSSQQASDGRWIRKKAKSQPLNNECISSLRNHKAVIEYLTLVSNNRMDRLGHRRSSEIPYKQVLIIPNRTKQVFMSQMPCYIFYNTFMNLLDRRKLFNHHKYLHIYIYIYIYIYKNLSFICQ